ncbi:MAG: class I SAM-dependent methyltransferase [Anaeromyxobacteraceae bacterium]
MTDPQNAPEPVLRGWLEGPGERRDVLVSSRGRVTLAVSFDGPEPAHGAVFDALHVEVARGREETLSRCRFDAGRDARASGSLSFLDDVYDTRALVYDGLVVSPKAALANVPLLLSNKDLVRPAFRAFVADAIYDISVWRKFFDDQERLLDGEAPEAAERARQVMVQSYGPAFFEFFNAHLAELGHQVEGFTPLEHERHGFYLRRHAWPYILASQFLWRINAKPLGYSGDAEMMRILYENRHVGTTVFERLMHKHPISIPAAQAVRNRRRLVADNLRQVDARMGTAAPDGLRFLSVAAGPAWELQDVYLNAEHCRRYRGALLDQDPHALAAAREVVARLERMHGAPIDVVYLQESVRTMLRPHVAERLGRHHFIYTMGLFDYLATPVARAVLTQLYRVLEPGGRIVVGNYHASNPSRVYMEYWGDWRLIYRTEQNMLDLAGELPGARMDVELDPSRCQMFLKVDKVA